MNVTISEPFAAFNDFVLVYACLTLVLGVIGNAFVLYGFRVDASAFNSLVKVLAVFDSLACIFHMPLDIASLYFPRVLPNMAICKITCYMIAFIAIGSAILLVAIATMRYRAVCRPHSPNLTIRHAHIISLVALISALALSCPIVFMFGVATITVEGITYEFCGVQNAYMMTPYPLTFYICLGSLFLIDFTAMSSLYMLAGRELWRKRKVFSSDKPKQTTTSTVTGIKSQFNHDTENPSGNQEKINMSAKKEFTRDKKMKKTLLMMLLVSIVFFLSYMPHLLIAYYLMAVNPDAFPTSSLTVWYGILMRSFYINNVADPFIYGFFSNEFRKNIKAIPEKFRNLCRPRY